MSDWREVKLGEVTTVINGATPDTKDDAYWGGPHQWITPAEMSGREDPFVSSTRRTLSDDGLAACSARLAPVKSVILSTRAPIGHLIINSVPMATNQGCRALAPSEDINYKFLYYTLVASVENLKELGTGTTFLELSAGKLKDFEIALPPLDEQVRIVRLIDEVHRKVHGLNDLLSSRLSALEEFEEVLMAALVEDVADDWTTKRLDGWCSIMTGPFGSQVHKSDYQKSGPALVNPQDIVAGQISEKKIKRVSPAKAVELGRWVLRSGDLVLGRRGEMGRCAVVGDEMAGWICGTGSFLVRPNDNCNPHLLAEMLRSKGYRRQMVAMSTGATMENLNNQMIGSLPVSLPPIDQQELLLGKIQAVKARIAETRKIVHSMRAMSDELLETVFDSIVEAA